MPEGLKFVLAILFVAVVVPLVTMRLTLNNKPTYHTIQPEVTGGFVQLTWQEKPVTNLEHLLLFIDKPADYHAERGLDIFPSQKTAGYYILPRGVYYNNSDIIKSKQKIYRMAKKDMRTWILIRGKAFSAELNDDQLKEIKSLVEGIKHQEPDAGVIGTKLMATGAWKELMGQLRDKETRLKNGTLDLTPDKKRSDFMR